MSRELDATIVIRTSRARKRELEREAKKAGRSFSEHLRERLKPVRRAAPVRDIDADLAKARRDAGC